MVLHVAFALLLQVEVTRNPVLEALVFLARHQRPDGSWGESPATCTCPVRKAVPVCDAAVARRLLRTLGDNDPEERDAAQAALRALGESALPHLRRGEEDPDSEIRARCQDLRSLVEIDPKGGSDAEVTGLALLAFLSAGYTQLSRDEHDGRSFGTVVKTGIRWLLARQQETGRFDPDDPVADATAALALLEDYGMTAQAILKEEAQKATDRIAAWKPSDCRGFLWKAFALKSAELGELPFPKSASESLDGIEEFHGDLATSSAIVVWIFFHKTLRPPRANLLRVLSPAMIPEPETRYVASLAAFQLDGPSGGFWTSWSADLRNTVLPRQNREKSDCRRGSWDGMGNRGRIRVTALSALDFEFYRR
jgi:hypothetical protein